MLLEIFQREGVDVRLETTVESVTGCNGEKQLRLVCGSSADDLVVDAILIGTGRLPNTDGLGLAAAGVAFDARGVSVDDYLRTSNRRIFAAGDVCLKQKFTHAADASARAGGAKRDAVSNETLGTPSSCRT